jgi:hypothetical protein
VEKTFFFSFLFISWVIGKFWAVNDIRTDTIHIPHGVLAHIPLASFNASSLFNGDGWMDGCCIKMATVAGGRMADTTTEDFSEYRAQ